MTETNPDFKQPPWTYSPKETMEWIYATNPNKKDKKHKKSKSDHFLSKINNKLDFDTEKSKITAPTFFSKILSKITGIKYIEESFDFLLITEIILRALIKAKFKHTVKIFFNKKIKHVPQDISSDTKKIIDNIKQLFPEITQYKLIEISAFSDDIYKCNIKIIIKKIHKENEHGIEISTKGLIREEYYHILLNYLKEKIRLKESISK